MIEEEKNNAERGLADATVSESTAKQEADEAKANRDAAQEAFDKGLESEEGQAAKQAYEEAKGETANAEQALADAQKAVADAEKDASDKESKMTNILDDYNNNLLPAANDAKDKMDAAESVKQVKENTLVAATDNEAAAQQERDAANDNVTNAKKDVADATQAKEAAEADKAQADENKTLAEQARDAAREKIETAQEKVKEGMNGFLNWMKEKFASDSDLLEQIDRAQSIYTGSNLPRPMDPDQVIDALLPVQTFTHMGQAGDATSLDNIKRATELMKECNELRKVELGDDTEFEKDLKVSLMHMAIAQVDANWSAQPGQWTHCRAFATGENLAKGYKDPFDGWYTKEKAIYEADPETFEAGHYLNMIDMSLYTMWRVFFFERSSGQVPFM